MNEKIKLLQHWAGVPDDGVVGPQTIDAMLAKLGLVAAPVPSPEWPAPSPSQFVSNDLLTLRVACELVSQEAIVLEAYYDSANPPQLTWGIGVTSNSGHKVERYKDSPQTIEHCLEVYLWMLRERYIPDVRTAFQGLKLNEAQFAAALSFHYNTGAILKTEWVEDYRNGNPTLARLFWETHYLNGGDLKPRRKAEAALFFDGVWSGDGTTTIWPVKKPSYTPDWGHGQKVDIRDDMAKALAG
jgi:GH24 family phage-related lysozyme (muramidase)